MIYDIYFFTKKSFLEKVEKCTIQLPRWMSATKYQKVFFVLGSWPTHTCIVDVFYVKAINLKGQTAIVNHGHTFPYLTYSQWHNVWFLQFWTFAF